MDSKYCPAKFLNESFKARQAAGDVCIAQYLNDNFKAMTTPKPTSSTFTGVTHPGNWPASAELAVEYKCHDRQFPDVAHEAEVVYFDTVPEFHAWMEQKREWIKGTDYDFSMDYKVYEWDWGPVFKYQKSM